MLSHWDGYPHGNNNYRVYHDPITELWTVMPSGLDQSLASQYDIWRNRRGIAMIDKCFAERVCKAAYAERTRDWADFMEAHEDDLVADIEDLRALLAPHIAADPRRDFNAADWPGHVGAVIDSMRNRPATVRQALAEQGFWSHTNPLGAVAAAI